MYNKKANTSHKRKDGRLIIGRKPLLETLKEGRDIEKIFLLKSATGSDIDELKYLARQQDIPLSLVPSAKLDRISRANHQGVLAFAGLIPFQPLQEIITQTVEAGRHPFIVVLEGVTDTRNLGAIARSAYCFGADALVFPLSNSAAITEESLKTSAGALEHLPVCRLKSIQSIFDLLHLNGIRTLASSLEASQPIHRCDLSGPIALILGAEDKGVSKYTLKAAHQLVHIPMAPHFDSLNVSVAGGILFHEIFNYRQKHV